jgi:hypothetical protein
MPIDTDKQILRLRKQHTPTRKIDVESGDGARLVRAQSVCQAILGGLIAVILFSILWVMLSTMVDRVFPWLTIALGLLIGLVMRRAGQGLDWRFPLLAAVMTVIGALVGNVVVAAAFTAQEFETGTLQILRAVTTMTWPVFFAEVISVADVIYALFGAAIAAFYAKRRLTRTEYLALRIWQQEQGR